MTADYFMNNVKNNTLVKDNDDCKPIIISALKAMYDLNMNGPSNTDFRNPLTRPRLPYAILLAIGGWSGGSPTNGIEAYDARADRWVNVTRRRRALEPTMEPLTSMALSTVWVALTALTTLTVYVSSTPSRGPGTRWPPCTRGAATSV